MPDIDRLARESEFSRWLRQGRGAAYRFVERNPPEAYKADLLGHCVRDSFSGLAVRTSTGNTSCMQP